MSGKRQPTDLIVANGRKHLSKTEEDQRRSHELRPDVPRTAKPPKWLPEALKKDFRAVGTQLIALGIYSQLDADVLGRYFIAHNQWLSATKKANEFLRKEDVEQAEAWSRLQDRYFKQAMHCATELGLTISSRCKLVVPAAMQDSTDEGTDEFTAMLEARKRAAGGM